MLYYLYVNYDMVIIKDNSVVVFCSSEMQFSISEKITEIMKSGGRENSKSLINQVELCQSC